MVLLVLTLLIVLVFRLMKPSILFACAHCSLICLLKVKSEDIQTPRSRSCLIGISAESVIE